MKRYRELSWPPRMFVVVGRNMIFARIMGRRRCLVLWKFVLLNKRRIEIRSRLSERNVHAIKAVLSGRMPSGASKIARGSG
jgi:hypothetical protein